MLRARWGFGCKPLLFFSRRGLEQAGLTGVRCSTFTPIGSWVWTQRQALLRPGFNHRVSSGLDLLIQRLGMVWYPFETLAQWVGLGEELVATGQRLA